ncbi:uncharacterized protein [Halyomorpha halys]|uniref:uncharacterized protein n=1 Tax=Halyomorpha halys TaxID=286706 RepID=UPI0006D51819|nr:uncharacterized protein LOC106677303 [Halyomorpha halys]
MQRTLPVLGGLAKPAFLGLPKSLTVSTRGTKSNAIGCNELEETQKKAVSCRRPDLRLKPPACYRYGFCREPDAPMRMSCPPKVKKRGRGPCCHEADDQRKGGCKVKK